MPKIQLGFDYDGGYSFTDDKSLFNKGQKTFLITEKELKFLKRTEDSEEKSQRFLEKLYHDWYDQIEEKEYKKFMKTEMKKAKKFFGKRNANKFRQQFVEFPKGGHHVHENDKG